MQKDHDFPHGLLFGPGGENAARANRPISAGEWITASGEWVNDRTHGQQFKARF